MAERVAYPVLISHPEAVTCPADAGSSLPSNFEL